MVLLQPFVNECRVAKKLAAQQMSNKTTLLSLFDSHTLNVPFCSPFHATFLLFIYLPFVGDFIV